MDHHRNIAQPGDGRRVGHEPDVERELLGQGGSGDAPGFGCDRGRRPTTRRARVRSPDPAEQGPPGPSRLHRQAEGDAHRRAGDAQRREDGHRRRRTSEMDHGAQGAPTPRRVRIPQGVERPRRPRVKRCQGYRRQGEREVHDAGPHASVDGGRGDHGCRDEDDAPQREQRAHLGREAHHGPTFGHKVAALTEASPHHRERRRRHGAYDRGQGPDQRRREVKRRQTTRAPPGHQDALHHEGDGHQPRMRRGRRRERERRTARARPGFRRRAGDMRRHIPAMRRRPQRIPPRPSGSCPSTAPTPTLVVRRARFWWNRGAAMPH